MNIDYHPFRTRHLIETGHGIINTQHDMGKIYLTHRTPEHIFRSKQAFCISTSEIETCHEHYVTWILIHYHNKRGETLPHRIKCSELRFMEQYDNQGDVQYVIPIREMERLIEGQWQRKQ